MCVNNLSKVVCEVERPGLEPEIPIRCKSDVLTIRHHATRHRPTLQKQGHDHTDVGSTINCRLFRVKNTSQCSGIQMSENNIISAIIKCSW